jgi:subtilisin family serine protease
VRRLAAVLLPLLLIPSLASAEPPTRVWVFFTDPGRSPAQLQGELALRRAELGPRTLARRSKVRGADLVDSRDLLPAHAYVDAVERSGATLRVQSRWLNAVSVDADPETQRALAALPFVRGLHPVGRAQGHALELTPAPEHANPEDYGVGWGQLELLGVPDLHDCGLTGAGVIMGVQDTGFLLDHQAYANTQVLAAHDFLDDDDIVGPELGDAPEQHVHGSLVLATITGDDPGNFLGVAPGVSVILSKTEHQTIEEPFEEDVYVEGLEWIEGMGADIFSASLSYSQWYTIDDFDGASAVTTVAVEIAVGNGLIVFAAMGNAGPEPSTLGAPADAEGAISLGAVNVAGALAPFSSRGPTADDRVKPDVLAPGWDVFTIDPATLDGYVPVSGTSLSTPIAAGVGALLLEAYPWLTPAEMAELLRSTASQADMPDSDWGYGIIDAAAAAELFCNCVDVDGDHYFAEACGGTDCDDSSVSVYPGAEELCNGIDDDCDVMLASEESDADQDGYLACADDCDDASEAVHPGASEICDNAIDDDCDELTDDLDPDCMSGDGDGDPGDGDGDGDPGDGDGDGDGGTESDSSGTGSATEETGGSIDDTSGCACTADTGRARSGAPLFLLLLGFAIRPRARRG